MKLRLNKLLNYIFIFIACLIITGTLFSVNIYAAGDSDFQNSSNEKPAPSNNQSDDAKSEITNVPCEEIKCTYNKNTNTVDITLKFNEIPQSDDGYVYIFEFENYESDSDFASRPHAARMKIDEEVTVSIAYSVERLFSRLVPAVKCDGGFRALAPAQYITNPEDLAANTTPIPDIPSKKGILLDPLTLEKDELSSLNVRRVVYNIPLSFIMGETDNRIYPTVKFKYKGETYKFNGYMLSGFDTLFAYLTANDYHITAIILNDWNKDFPEIIHPKSRTKTGRSEYYAFNTEERDGVRMMEAAALFLAKRYSGGNYGLINDWVIANEVNQQKVWNYMATDDLSAYTESFEKSFRTFYNAIKSSYSNARVYFSIDHDWNNNGGLNYMHFNGKDLLTEFNSIAKEHGNYDWSLSIHPYPSPLSRTKFWTGNYDKSENAALVSPMNLSVITDFMKKDEMLDTKGNVRQIGVTELGFSSKSGEKTQAAAFAYCYYIINDNEYINSFLMNRQTDSAESLKSGLALGIYNPDYSAKYIADVFANIDADNSDRYLTEMLEIIGADSLDSALKKAR